MRSGQRRVRESYRGGRSLVAASRRGGLGSERATNFKPVQRLPLLWDVQSDLLRCK